MSESLVPVSNDSALCLSDASRFEHIQRVAAMFSKSDLVPAAYKNNVPNCIIALEMSTRMKASPLMLMQNLHIIHGKPAFGSSFLIASINDSRRFSPLRFTYVGDVGTKSRGCYAHAIALQDKTECIGVTVTMEIAEKEGWTKKNGSKWQTMPELMLMYRAATWWARMYAPEQTMGFQTQDEIIDLIDPDAIPASPEPPAAPAPRAKRDKGLSGARRVSEAAPEQPAATTDAPQSGPAPSPEEAPAVTEEGPADQQPAANEVQPAATNVRRCEVRAVQEQQAKKANGTVGPVTKVTLVGDHEGIAYFDGPASAFAPVGAVIDATLESRDNKGAVAYVILKFEVMGG
ncbi:MAG: recombinase RecT [Opitutaceae bacterium]|nr:recombinase RecT [Opitutaceae bacterium]